MKQNVLFLLAFLWLIGITCQSCGPVFSELQSARTVGQNRFEATPFYTSSSSSSDGETDGVQNEIGGQFALGLTPKTDLRLRYEYVWAKGDEFGNGISVIAAGPKISLLENKIALSLPVGTAFGQDITDAWEFQPSMLFTLPAVPNKLDITLAPKYVMTFCKDCENYEAINLGLAISNDLSKWAIRPEYGQLYHFGDKGHYGQFSIAISKTFGK